MSFEIEFVAFGWDRYESYEPSSFSAHLLNVINILFFGSQHTV